MVNVDKSACLGDGLCIAECPTGALAADENGKAEANDECIDCLNCITVCPADAIVAD